MNDKLPFKIVLVHGNEQNNYEIISHTNEDDNQSYVESLEMHYLENKELQDMCLNFVSWGNIVILDTTSYHSDAMKENGKSILFMFPQKPSEFQIQTIEDLMTFFEDANTYRIWYDLVKENDEIKCQIKMGNDISVVKNHLENYHRGKER